MIERNFHLCPIRTEIQRQFSSVLLINIAIRSFFLYLAGILQCDRCCTIAFTKRGIIHRLFIFALIISKIWQIDHHPTITWSIKAWNFYSIDAWKILKNRRNVEIYFQFEFIAKNVRSFILWQTILALDTQNWRIYPFLMREA